MEKQCKTCGNKFSASGSQTLCSSCTQTGLRQIAKEIADKKKNKKNE